MLPLFCLKKFLNQPKRNAHDMKVSDRVEETQILLTDGIIFNGPATAVFGYLIEISSL
jgi:hypothetical protein